MGKTKKVGVSNPPKPVDNSNLTSSSKTIKANKFRPLRAYECKKIFQEKGIDLNSCIDSYVHKGKRAFIRQCELTKVSAFWHLFVCANLVGSSNAIELNREKIKIVYTLVTNKSINLGEVLIEHIDIVACATHLDKKLAFPRFISHLCLAKGLKSQDDDVLLPPLENFSEKRMATMSYKEKGKSSDTFRLFGESHDSSHVSSTPILPSWAIQLKNEVEESQRMIEASQKKIEELNAKVVLQDEKIK
ncbi:hypothetical protein LWI29_001127 [Acer saccharum]|uniref:Putative plant transposon protein domain-containing protein n=1 Tax=Acer saccharum TaxID=4024 RepID=A0AA39VLL5_ACESA|nr:hypothetical protein LWI29_001127 [Acer saccharum]